MIITSRSQCRRCTHYHGGQKCDAYPDKIPDKLWSGEVAHGKPFPGDHGIQRDPLQVPNYIMPYD